MASDILKIVNVMIGTEPNLRLLNGQRYTRKYRARDHLPILHNGTAAATEPSRNGARAPFTGIIVDKEVCPSNTAQNRAQISSYRKLDWRID